MDNISGKPVSEFIFKTDFVFFIFKMLWGELKALKCYEPQNFINFQWVGFEGIIQFVSEFIFKTYFVFCVLYFAINSEDS